MKKAIMLVAMASFITIATSAYADTYQFDLAHSSVNFKIRHLFSKTSGNFNDFSGTIQMEGDNLDTLSIEATVQAASINTENEDRDKHLRSADFFDVEQFPTITFKSGLPIEVADGTFKLPGTLTLHGVEKEVVWAVEYHGGGQDPWGHVRNGLTATLTLDRKEFGIVFNKTLDNGGLMLGDDVEVSVEVEGILQEEVPVEPAQVASE